MSYETIEISVDTGQPFDLYRFTFGSEVFLQTSCDRVIVFNGETYLPQAIQRSNLESTSQSEKSSLSLSASKSNPLVDLFKFGTINNIIGVTIFTGHSLQSDLVDEVDPTRVRVLWKGRILNFELGVDSMVTFALESVFSSAKRLGIRRKFQRQCPFELYGNQCGVSKLAHQFTTTVVNSHIGAPGESGWLVTIDVDVSSSPGIFGGGYMTWINPLNGRTEHQSVKLSSDVNANQCVLVLSKKPWQLPIGHSVTIYKGCDHNIDTEAGCGPRFNNHVNFGGMPYIPTKNPFEDTPMY